jgi:preprotein translocase subunit SecA
MRIFGSERMDTMLKALGLKEDEAIVHPWINKALEKAQAKVEARNFDIRKNLLKYDNVMNDQRKAIFEQRRELMSDADLGETIADMRRQVVDDLVDANVPEKSFPEQWHIADLREQMQGVFDVDLPIADWAKEEGIDEIVLHERLIQAADERAAKKAVDIGPNVMRQIEKAVLLQTLDHLWREHLVTLEHLRQVIGLRGYGQRDPLNEYKNEAFTLFEHMLSKLREAVTGQLMHVQLAPQGEAPPLDAEELPPMEAQHLDPITGENEFALEMAGAGPGNGGGATARAPRARAKVAAAPKSNPNDPSSWGKVQRNALCPCGSGKKYKHCHGTLG